MKTPAEIYHGRDLRKGRFSEPGRAYLLTATIHQRQRLFNAVEAGCLVADLLEEACLEGLAETMAWVVMPDHFHWLITLRNSSLNRLMQRIKSKSAVQLNRYLQGEGQIWQKGYHDHALRKEEEVIEVARYIVNNPVRAGLVRNVHDYPLWGAVGSCSDVFGRHRHSKL